MVIRRNMRTVVRVITFSVALALVLGGLALTNYMEKERYRWQLEASYQHYFNELAESMRGVSTALHKGHYSGSNVLMSALAGEISREAASAKSALSGLPFSDIELEKTAKFLSQVGDYAYYLAKKDASGKPLTDEERANMESLSNTAYSLSQSLDELYASVAEGTMNVSFALDNEQGAEARLSGVAAALAEIETQFPEYAGLIYDGPFSEHITTREASFLKGRSEVDTDTAKLVAARACGKDASELALVGETNDNLPTYSFAAGTDGDGEVWYFDVTKARGVLLDMYCSRVGIQPTISADDCVERAKDWLEQQGMYGLIESYYYEQSGVVTVNFAAYVDDIVLYPDLMKVAVSAQDGQVIGYEGRGYIMNHCDRELAEPNVSMDDARAMLRSGLEVESERLALIPTAGEMELLCYEFLCGDGSGERVLIYVNAETGIEEQILILVESEAGTLAI